MKVDTAIIGAGAAGMMCAAQLNEMSDLKVLVVEGNEKAAKDFFLFSMGISQVIMNCTVFLPWLPRE